MISSECVEKIRMNFPACPKNIEIDDMVASALLFLQSLHYNEYQIESFYNSFMENYNHQHRYFPCESDFRKILRSEIISSNYSGNNPFTVQKCIDDTKNYNLTKILSIVKRIQNKILTDGGPSLSGSDTVFFITWEELASIERHLIDSDWPNQQIETYLMKVRESIISGENIKFDVDKIKVETEQYDDSRNGKSKVSHVSNINYFEMED